MNKLALLVKDEEGMTLVELLAVIVILSIVAAIGGVAIAGVIQRSREDARVADVQMLFEAATLAESSDSFISKGGAATTTNGTTTQPVAGTVVTAKQLGDAGYSTSVAFLKDKDGKDVPELAKFKLAPSTATEAAKLQLTLDAGIILAGSKANIVKTDMTATEVKNLTRATLF